MLYTFSHIDFRRCWGIRTTDCERNEYSKQNETAAQAVNDDAFFGPQRVIIPIKLIKLYLFMGIEIDYIKGFNMRVCYAAVEST